MIPQIPSGHMRPTHPTYLSTGRHAVLHWRSTRGEGGTLGSVDEVLSAEQYVGAGLDTTQDDTNFDLGAEVRHRKAQREEAADQLARDIDMPMEDVDLGVAQTPQEMIRHLRLQVRDLRVQSAHFEE